MWFACFLYPSFCYEVRLVFIFSWFFFSPPLKLSAVKRQLRKMYDNCWGNFRFGIWTKGRIYTILIICRVYQGFLTLYLDPAHICRCAVFAHLLPAWVPDRPRLAPSGSFLLFVLIELFDRIAYKQSYIKSCVEDRTKALIIVYKSLNGVVPEYLSSKLLKRNGTCYSLRDFVNTQVAPLPRARYLKNSFTYNGTALWNSLQYNLRKLRQFKK